MEILRSVRRWRRLLGLAGGAMCLGWSGTGASAAPEQLEIALPDGTTVPLRRVGPDRAEGLRPGILLFHGGGWTRGDPRSLLPHAEALAADGRVCLLPDLVPPEGGGLPAALGRARAIAHAVQSRAATYGMDPTQLYLLGESSGGHLAAQIATESAPGTWAGVMLWSPLLDLTTIRWLGTRHGLPFDRAALSPLTHLTSAFPPTLILAGAADRIVSFAGAEAWQARALELGVPTRLDRLPGEGHAFAAPSKHGRGNGPGFAAALTRTRSFLSTLVPLTEATGGFERVHVLQPEDGWQPYSGLSSDGYYAWGAGHLGGASHQGTLFRIALDSRTFETVHAFAPGEGSQPFAGLTFSGRGVWGVTQQDGERREGTLFRWDPALARLEVIHRFNAQPDHGELAWAPRAAPLAVDGKFYGTTFHGGADIWAGAVYRFDPASRTLSLLHSFDPQEGRFPTGRLLHYRGWLYGTLSDYGQADPSRAGALYRLRPDGSGFTIVHRFAGGSRGAHPRDRLTAHPAGFLLGTTYGRFSDPQDQGTLFLLDPDSGEVETLLDFNLLADEGGKPSGPIVLGRNPNELFLATQGSVEAGSAHDGALLQLMLELRPRPNAAPVVRVASVTRLHRFSGGPAGSSPSGDLLLHGEVLWGVTTFGHDGEAPSPPETESGGLVYALTLP